MYLPICFPYVLLHIRHQESRGRAVRGLRPNAPIDGLLCTQQRVPTCPNLFFHLSSLAITRHHSPSIAINCHQLPSPHACAHQMTRHSARMLGAIDTVLTAGFSLTHALQTRFSILPSAKAKPSFCTSVVQETSCIAPLSFAK